MLILISTQYLLEVFDFFLIWANLMTLGIFYRPLMAPELLNGC